MQLFYFESVSCINTKLKNNDNIEYSAKRKSMIPVTITVLNSTVYLKATHSISSITYPRELSIQANVKLQT